MASVRGDSNTHFFFAALKQRTHRNRIESLYTEEGYFLKDPDLVAAEIRKFYVSLLGSKAPWFPAVDLVTVRRGPALSFDAQSMLCAPVSQ